MGREIELKLKLPQAAQQRLQRSPLLRGAERKTERLRNIYYDTPDLALQCSGIALRLRRSGRRWLQTVKCAGEAGAGLSSRPEWETPYTGSFDFAAVDDDATRKRLERLKARLVPIFETNFSRTSWRRLDAESELIVALDRGNVAANGKSVPISELEIELATGSVEHIFFFAERLAQDFALTPGLRSKAEQGYRLFLGSVDAPVRAAPLVLDAADSPLVAFRRIAQACLHQLQLNHDGALGDDAEQLPEYIHQLRVAMRRFRAALRLFAPVLSAELVQGIARPFKTIMAALGNARDLDVLMAEIVDPVVGAMPAEPRIAALAHVLEVRRQEARQYALAVLASPFFGQTMLLALKELATLPAPPDSSEPLPHFVNTRLKHFQKKFRNQAGLIDPNDPATLHRLRIAGKRLRYGLEFFAPLLPARQATSALKQLAQLQDELGQLNDLASAGRIFEDCTQHAPDLREAISLVGGWHASRHAELHARIPQDLATLEKTPFPKAK